MQHEQHAMVEDHLIKAITAYFVNRWDKIIHQRVENHKTSRQLPPFFVWIDRFPTLQQIEMSTYVFFKDIPDNVEITPQVVDEASDNVLIQITYYGKVAINLELKADGNVDLLTVCPDNSIPNLTFTAAAFIMRFIEQLGNTPKA